MATIVNPEPEIATPHGDEPLYEVVNGQRVEPPPIGAYPSHIKSKLHVILGIHARTHNNGFVECENLFCLDAQTVLQRRPDVAFVSYRRWPEHRGVPATAAWDVVPDLAVEVVSPTDRAQDLMDKIHEYFQAGVQIVWVVYPIHRLVQIYESFTQIRVLTRVDALDGGLLLPGFQLPLATLFEDEAAEVNP